MSNFKKIGIIVADKEECQQLNLSNFTSIKEGRMTVYCNRSGDVEVVVVHSGIGLVNAAAAAQFLISVYHVEVIFNYGAVGAIDRRVYDLVTPAKIFFHDVLTPWYKRGHTPGEKPFYCNAAKSLVNDNIASGSSFISSKDIAQEIDTELGVKIFDMEVAAIAQIADANKVPIFVYKCVSDVIGSNVLQLENINARISKAGHLALDAMRKDLQKICGFLI